MAISAKMTYGNKDSYPLLRETALILSRKWNLVNRNAIDFLKNE